MATITLDQIKADIEAKYAPVIIDLGDDVTCTLVQAMRLTKEQRQHIARLQETLQSIEATADDAEDQMVAALVDIIHTAATDQAEADALVETVDSDVATLLEIVTKYGQATQLGEASPSAS